ncbi:hypothetical protein [Azospirillum picis]|uniref:Tudor domain-containing protein n=1 Tax=Azospirillum picis TaxID=488438 RepID=A0ABU0MQV6_9PROT|nr:hypothetical protein [Azospirillum picis]MBP2302266.1 hypothetical protein [Azospirillum picis]MDQ0535845.1 hypothetical protein [Azospirillum picis]
MSRLLLLCLAALALLSACGPVYETQYSLTPPASPEGRLCVSQCQQNRSLCRQNCGLAEQACVSDARARARYDYQAYVATRKAEKAPIKKSISDFDHSSSCGSSSCEARCDADYRDCFGGACGGRVSATQVCTAFCDKEVPAATPRPALSPVPPAAAIPPSGAPAGTAVAEAPETAESLCQPGTLVKVRWKGETYLATVKGTLRKDGRCPVHYDGYSMEDDEAVSVRRMSRR